MISIVGGGVQDQLLCQFTASACGRPVTAGPVDASALGNIMVQMIAGGQVKDIEEGRELIRRTFPLALYQPRRLTGGGSLPSFPIYLPAGLRRLGTGQPAGFSVLLSQLDSCP